MAAPGRVHTRTQRLRALQRVERTVDVRISGSRIEPEAGQPRYIETVYGVGCRFVV